MSCKIDTNALARKNETLKVYIYANGHPVREYLLSHDDERHQKLMRWLENNQSGWSQTPVTYVPGTLVTGRSFSLNFIDRSVVINFANGQFIKKIDKIEYSFLLN